MLETYVYGGAAGGQIYRTHLPDGVSALLTTAPSAPTYANALASNPDNGGVMLLRQRPRSCTTGTPRRARGLLLTMYCGISTGFSPLMSQTWIAVAERIWMASSISGRNTTTLALTWSQGDMYDVYELTLAADGKSVTAWRRLNITTGIAPRRALDLGGFGDIVVRRNGASGIIYGATASQASGIGRFWSFDLATNTYTLINTTTTWDGCSLRRP